MTAANKETIDEFDRLLAHAKLGAPMTPEDRAMLAASQSACTRWPEDTPTHRALRAAFLEGAVLITTNFIGEE